jgi:hypothetical protein
MPGKDLYRIYDKMLQLHPNRRRETSSIVIPKLQPCGKGRAQRAPKRPSGRTFFSKLTSPQQSYAAALRQDKEHQEPQTTQTEKQYVPQEEFQKTGLSVQAPSSSNNDTVATVVHHIMTKLTKAESEKERVMFITKLVLNLMQKKMADRIHRPLKIIAFNENGIWRPRYEKSKQLQDLLIDVALLSETNLKPHERLYIPNFITFIVLTDSREEKRNYRCS